MSPLIHSERKPTMNPRPFSSGRSGPRPGLLTVTAAALLAACGGGGGGGGGTGGPEPTVTAMAINPRTADLRNLVVTITGTHLTAGLNVTSAQCTTLTRSTTAPLASDASTAYYQCATTTAAPNSVAVNAARSSDGTSLGGATFTIGATPTLATAVAGEGAVAAGPGQAAVAGTGKYSQQITITLTGTNVNQGLDVSSPSCSGMTLSVSPPFVSTASTTYYRCRADSANGRTQATVAPLADVTTTLATPQFIVDAPQVTLKMKLGGTPVVQLGDVVISMDPNITPLAVNNFLDYVNAGFYNNTIFHDNVSNTPAPGAPPARFILQGGGYGPTSGLPVPVPKTTNPPVVLETVLSNVQWSVAMAPADPANQHTATSQFFINLVDNSGRLDAIPGAPNTGYAVFGSVSAGTSVVDAMASAFCTQVSGFSICLPTPNVIIETAVQTR